MNHIRAITFDLDDTLWEIGPVIRRAEAELWRWLEANCPGIPEKFTAEAASALREQVLAEHADRCHDFRFVRRTTLCRMFDACGYPREHLDGAIEVFERFRNRVALYPDVLPALELLSRRYRLVAVTNGSADLRSIGISDLFTDVVTAFDTGAAKPAREIFDEAVRRAGATHAEVLHVGDHPECDVEGARSAGLRAVWMNRAGREWPGHLPPPAAVVASTMELCRMLEPASPRRVADCGR